MDAKVIEKRHAVKRVAAPSGNRTSPGLVEAEESLGWPLSLRGAARIPIARDA